MAEVVQGAQQSLNILPLRSLLKDDPEVARRLIEGYVSFRPDECDYLREMAIDFERKDLGRTYLILNSETRGLKGYFTIGLKCTIFDQLSRAVGTPSGYGRLIRDAALKTVQRCVNLEGGTVTRIDCIDDLQPYYESYALKCYGHSRETGLCLMIRCISGNGQ